MAAVDSWCRGVPQWHLIVLILFVLVIGIFFGWVQWGGRR